MALVAPTTFRFTREQYCRMGEEGLFSGKRVELLDGEVIEMTPQLSPHAFTVNELVNLVILMQANRFVVRCQSPIVLGDWSEPEPDVALCQPVADRYASAHPRADQVMLVIEVAESSLAYDRTTKMRAYARAGIPHYWIANLVDRRLEAHSDPDPAASRYRGSAVLGESDLVPLPTGGTIAVASFLPPRP